ncbi:TetR/AcrR family transcriptional regulator [Actinophytocola gossypii]|uniref:TetR/AcrR family transcriptional regulator n=1 Tax=Actinophytocola gossypii TaxID=2812003 RepID=A0ABT2JGM8_9PSEU|nr:TetR/AcrR family transcriptional regulator [Actinophytocola gossypii]MCT2586684.1 TetR/AcrR family transcriptional regulator [Actinophytocola gossypii]
MTYHHGDLRRVLLDTALGLIAERGPNAVSLRDLARAAGVSHAAPAHHFGDKAGLFTAIAVQGQRLLADALAEELDLRRLGATYVRFATEHASHFEIMFRPDLYHRDDPELVAAKARTSDLLRAAIPGDGRDADRRVLAAWSIAHGFATLLRSGNLDHLVGDGDAEAEFAEVAELLDLPGPTPT